MIGVIGDVIEKEEIRKCIKNEKEEKASVCWVFSHVYWDCDCLPRIQASLAKWKASLNSILES